uniref:Uncharacterized protein n=1 Tax=Anopheles triannulatus TaxID=58253 RepID=A0A2M4AKT0_9DIPT
MRDLPKSTAHVVKKSSEIVRPSGDRRQPGGRSGQVSEEEEKNAVPRTQQPVVTPPPPPPQALFVSANTIPGRPYHGDSVRLSKTCKDVAASSSRSRKLDVGHYPSTSAGGGTVADSRDTTSGGGSLRGTGSPQSLLSTASEDEEILEFISNEINVSDEQTASSGSSSSSSDSESSSESFSEDDEMVTSTELQGSKGQQVTGGRLSSCEPDDTTTGRTTGGVTINQSQIAFSSAPAPFTAPVGPAEMMKIATPEEERSRIPRFKKGPTTTTTSIGQGKVSLSLSLALLGTTPGSNGNVFVAGTLRT